MPDLVTMRDLSSPSDSLGRYRLVGVLGQGSMGTVHLAVASGIGAFKKLVVVKELKAEFAMNPAFVDAFSAGARLAARLNHPHIVQTLEADREGHRHFLAMEFLDGQSLRELTKRTLPAERLSLTAHVRALCDVLLALHHAHELADYDGRELRIVHGDVSPENVFITYDGQVKLLDFGGTEPAPQEETTSPGVFKGKFAYASPEQVRGRPLDRRTDVFAVGVMLWEALTGRRFATGPVTPAAVKARIFGLEPRVSRLAPNAPHGLLNICNRAIAVDRADRYSSAEDFRDALIAFLRASGELSDTKAIGRGMRTMFAEERAAMHRIIDAALNVDDQPNSAVRSRPRVSKSPPQAPHAPEDERTTLTNLPPPRDDAATPRAPSVHDEYAPDFRPGRRGRLIGIILGGAAIAAAAGFWFGITPSAGSAESAPKGGASAATPVASALVPAVAAEAPPEPSGSPVAEPLTPPASQLPPSAAAPPQDGTPRKHTRTKRSTADEAPRHITPGNPYEE